MKKRILYLILPIITLVLEIMPYGAVCNFANPEGEPFRRTFSYFDLIPFGYANFTPFITALITCFAFVLILIFCIIGNVRIANVTKNILCVATVISLGALLFGIEYFSFVGALITLSLFAELVLLQIAVKKSK